MGDFFQALIGDAAAARHVAQERDDVVLTLGSTESREKDPVVGHGHVDEGGTGCRSRRCEGHRSAGGRSVGHVLRSRSHPSILALRAPTGFHG